jgi:hypothetical protein
MGTMLKRPWMLSAVLPAAHKGLTVAQGLSPTGDPAEDPHPGEYRAAFGVEYGLKSVKFRGRPGKRQVATLVNRSTHSRIVEYGNSKTPEYRVLRRTIDAMKAAHGGS